MSEETFTPAEVCRLTGASYRQLDYWDSTDLANPSVQLAAGPGNPRVYSGEDVRRIAAIVRLLEAGMSLDALRTIVARRRSVAELEQIGQAIWRNLLELASVNRAARRL